VYSYVNKHGLTITVTEPKVKRTGPPTPPIKRPTPQPVPRYGFIKEQPVAFRPKLPPAELPLITRTGNLRKIVFARDNGLCVYCGAPGDTLDHVVPQVRGGGNDPGNLVVSCCKCNHAKDDLPLDPKWADVMFGLYRGS